MCFCVNFTLTFFPDDAQVGVPGQARFPRGALHLGSRLVGNPVYTEH